MIYLVGNWPSFKGPEQARGPFHEIQEGILRHVLRPTGNKTVENGWLGWFRKAWNDDLFIVLYKLDFKIPSLHGCPCSQMWQE